ncbi:type II toxin-antitoxin system ParD family antitoxin [Pleomorphomonas sp. NRKKF1]|nr:type II toxin-antitoxin system ParD family antitoxin [Pleomorphomonas sp. NRK KF1]MCM5555323.1 type II toxin-antitoxin system ParD family antitoxin [Pleomorphomonas sp. NRK KF1]
MGNLNVSLTDELVSYVKTKVESGRYASSSEVVREALRLMEKLDHAEGERLRFLQQAWQDGIESGDFRPLDAEAVNAEGRKRLMAKE